MNRFATSAPFLIDESLNEIFHDLFKRINNLAEAYQNLGDNPGLPNDLRNQCLSIAESYSLVQHLDENINDFSQVLQLALSMNSSFENLLASLSIPSSHPFYLYLQFKIGLKTALEGEYTEALKHFQ
jgi:hypothetical protein